MKDIKIEFNCKKGFTLVETLITLGIIGVVATITIPNLIATYQKKQVATQLKESYSIIQQAVKLSQDENGEIDSWDTTLSGHDFFNKYLSNYIKWQKEYTSTELTQSAPRTLLNGTRYTGTTYTGRNSAHFTLINGSMISMNLDNANANGLWVGIDVNGLSKPNRVGRDTFLFFWHPEYGLRPLGDIGTPNIWRYGDFTRDKIKTNGGNSCNKSSSGYWCSALIVHDGWNLAKDYPW